LLFKFDSDDILQLLFVGDDGLLNLESELVVLGVSASNMKLLRTFLTIQGYSDSSLMTDAAFLSTIEGVNTRADYHDVAHVHDSPLQLYASKDLRKLQRF